jgi:hypothetical protein
MRDRTPKDSRRGHLFRWSELRPFGNSLIAHATIAVPLIGYFILLNDQIVEFLKLHTSICNQHPCDVSWRLQLLYFGGTLYGFAAGVYSLCCPTVIKKYAGGAEYLDAESDYFSNRNNLNYLLKRIEEIGGKAPDVEARLHYVGSTGSYKKAQLGDVFAEHYVALNYQKFTARLFCFFGFSTGMLLAGVPTVITFMQVLVMVIERWF